MTTRKTTCLIWATPTSPCIAAFPSDPLATWIDDSPRAGGSYAVHLEASGWIGRIDETKKLLLTSWLIDQRAQGDDCPLVTRDVLQQLDRYIPLTIYQRAERLLRFFGQHSPAIGQQIAIFLPVGDPADVNRARAIDDVPESVCNLWRAMAWSESATIKEVGFLLAYLSENGWTNSSPLLNDELASVTVEGYARIEDSRVGADRTQAFVAIWFNDETNDAFDQGIQPAIEEAGYSAMRIDRKEHVNKIDDEIIAEIRRSRFLVADFSQGDDGARGGVYFEAGFALGLGIPVIYTCRKSDIDKLHFDTRQYNHIVWETHEELRTALQNRILAVIGEGPNSPSGAT